jgi:hypothetical protein
MAVTMKKAVFWLLRCVSAVKTMSRKTVTSLYSFTTHVPSSPNVSDLKLEATRSSETSVLKRLEQRHIQKHGIHQNYPTSLWIIVKNEVTKIC